MQKLLLVVFICLYGNYSFGQDYPAPKIGEPCPNFTITVYHQGTKKTKNLNDFKGKWLLLDFWTTECTSCVQGFPRLDSLRRLFSDKIEIVTIGRDQLFWGDRGISTCKKLFEKLSQKISLNLPSSYDTLMFKIFQVAYFPYTVWIDEKGIIRAATGGHLVTKLNVESMLNGKIHELPKVMNLEDLAKRDSAYNYDYPFLTKENGGFNYPFLYRSVFTRWTPDMEQFLPELPGVLRLNIGNFKGIQLFGATLSMLYSVAYYGSAGLLPGDSLYELYWPDPVLETKDSLEFHPDFDTGEHLYCYSLLTPKEKANSSYIMDIMQGDLKHFFGFKVRLEYRMMPCRYIKRTNPEIKIETHGVSSIPIPQGDSMDAAGCVFQNATIKDVIRAIFMYHSEIPIFDETKINFNVDLRIDASMQNLEQIRLALQIYGLDLVDGYKKMNVIVISDN